MPIRYVQCEPGVAHESEPDHNWEDESEPQQEYSQRPAQIISGNSRLRRRRGQLLQLPSQGFELFRMHVGRY